MGRLWILAVAFLVGLGAVVGDGMSVEARGVLVGVVLGAAILSIVIVCLGVGISEYFRHEEARDAERTKQMQIALEAARFAALSHAKPQYPTPDGCYVQGTRVRQIGGPN